MTHWPKQRPVWLLGTGFLLGLMVGVGMLIGALAMRSATPAPVFTLPGNQLHAVSTDSSDTFAMATGPISDGVEGVFFLDFLTGDLQCWVLNNRTGALGGQFRHNVVGDLGVEQGKKPRYLMVTGVASFRRGTSGMTPADSLVYVADANTGQFAAYALPWNRNAAARATPQVAEMIVVGKGSARNWELRGQ